MKIAVISDIHGNITSLDAVLLDISNENIEEIYFLGDIVGYYYDPDLVINTLKRKNIKCIKGNHEDLLLKARLSKSFRKLLKEKYGSGHEMALDKLNTEQIKWISKLPESMCLKIDKMNIGFYHGSPQEKNLYLYPNSDVEKLKYAAQNHDYVFIGHSHHPFIFSNESSTLINVGSVGQLRSKGGLSSWAIFDTLSFSIQIKYTPYDTTDLISQVKKVDPQNEYLWKVLTR